MKNSSLTVSVACLAMAYLALFCSASSTVHNFDGNVYDVNGTPLTGVNVSAWINDAVRASYTSTNQSPGYESYYNLDVQGDTSEAGSTVYFRVEGILANESASFQSNGDEDNYDLHLPVEVTTTTSTTTPTTTSTTTPTATSTTTSTTTTSTSTSTTTPATTLTTVPSETTTT